MGRWAPAGAVGRAQPVGSMDWWIDGWCGTVLGGDGYYTVHLNRRLGNGKVSKLLNFFGGREEPGMGDERFGKATAFPTRAKEKHSGVMPCLRLAAPYLRGNPWQLVVIHRQN